MGEQRLGGVTQLLGGDLLRQGGQGALQGGLGQREQRLDDAQIQRFSGGRAADDSLQRQLATDEGTLSGLTV